MESLERRVMMAATPVISEILASNQHTVADQFGTYSDWVEICNPDPRQSINLANWKLKYKSTVWTFPAMTLGPNQYRVIFCDSKNLTDPTTDLHTNFNLSKSGANLSLLDPSNNVVSSYTPYPAGSGDISYGIGQTLTETKLVAAGATARYYVPTSGALGSSWTGTTFNDGLWSKGPTGLGFANVVPGFAVTNYKATLGSINNLSDARAVINNTSNQSWTRSETAPVINYFNTDGQGEFTSDRTFPGMSINVNQDCFVLLATGTIHIPSAGAWTFGVNSDDGFELKIGGQTLAYDGLRGPSDSYGTFTFAAAGDYPLSLTFFENGGGSGVELFASQGNRSGWDSTFRLVGDTAGGGLSVMSTPITGAGVGSSSTFATDVRTNVKSVMQQANNASIYTRISFDAPDLALLQTLTLKMAYDSGYVAYLNGTEVARSNAPANVTWNSAATGERNSDLLATTYETVDLTAFIGLLKATGNVLAIQAMNSSTSDGDLLIMPELSQMSLSPAGLEYFGQPTPGLPNTPDTWQPDVSFSVTHGFFDAPFQVSLSTTASGASIYYTLDGTEPSATHGTRYTGPIAISSTAALRAVSVVSGGQTGIVSTETYVFPEQVIGQTNTIPGMPGTWGSSAADYAMDPRITTDPQYRNQLKQDLLSIPTMSIVTDQANLFDPSTGIYTNPNATDWDRPVSFEYFSADGSESFQINAALRMQGGVGRDAIFEKHSFRLIFKSPYGPTQLVYPLFGDGATNTFDTLTLRANFNDGYSWGDDRTQLIRDQFANRTLLSMGQPAPHGTYVHLYINGVYWGVYNPTERPDASFDATYFGGDKDQWEAINAGAPINSTSGQSFNDLMSFFDNNDVSTTAGYQKLQGNNPDGTRNPAYPDLLDVNNYIDYLLMNFYIGNTDWPGHNYYMGRDTSANSTGFKSLPWDSEMALGGGWASLGTDSTGIGSSNNDIGKPYYYLRNNADFRMLFADHVQKFMFNGGPLTAAAGVARYKELADFVAGAMVAETARWGDIPGDYTNGEGGSNPHTQAQWLSERDYMLNTFLPQRTAIVIQQLRNAGLLPTFDAPSFALNGTTQYGGTFLPGAKVTISAPSGTIYYTLDGSDPRLPGGGISPKALAYSSAITLTQGTQVRARVWKGGVWSALADAGFYVDLAPAIRITELMYNPPAPTAAEAAAGFTDNNDFEFLEIRNISAQSLPLRGLRLSNGVDFTFPDVSIAPGQYLLVVSNVNAFKMRYPGVSPSLIVGQYTGHLDSSGEKLELDAPNGGIVHEFKYDNSWFDQTDGEGFSLTVRDALQDRTLWDENDGWRASAAPLGSPGTDDTLANPGSVVINEVLAHPAAVGGDVLELANTTDQAVGIGGWFLSDDKSNLMKYRIADGTVIPAHGFLLFTQAANFASTGDPGCLVPFGLNQDGDDVYLSSSSGGIVGGYRAHVDFGASPVGVSIGRIAKSTGGTDFGLLQTPTFGSANSIAYIAPLVVNEVQYNPSPRTAAEIAAGITDADQFEFIELVNRSNVPQNLGDFYLGDGVGFSFGWLSDGLGTEKQTLEAGASATWSASGLASAPYDVWVHLNLLDADGKRNTKLDDHAQYTVTYAGGSVTVTLNQNVDTLAGDAWVKLGTFNFDGPASVKLVRDATTPDAWTRADAVKFTAAGQDDVVVAAPTVTSFATLQGLTTLAPGASVVLVSNYAAFNARYGTVANGIPVAGVYTGNLSNGGEWVRLFQRGPADPLNGYIPGYEIDRLNYADHSPWPAEADGEGAALIRAHVAAYGNDPANWQASNDGGTPGKANIVIDRTAPSVPGSLVAKATINPNTITLTWAASTDPQSAVDHYVIYRDGQVIGTAAGTSYADTALSGNARHIYAVAAVNRDGYESAKSAEAAIAIPGVMSTNTPDTTHVEILFTEALTPAVATAISHYAFSGGAITGAVLSVNNTKLTLTTSSAMAIGSSYTLTMTGLTTASGNQLPASIPLSFAYTPVGTGSILREYWTNINGSAVTDLTSSPNYPSNPTGRALETSFESPLNWAENYGQRFQGYLTPPTSGFYTFWIASDDASELWLSTDSTPGKAKKIAYVSGWTNSREWTREANQQSAAVYLLAGQKYYVQALHKEGAVYDNLAVRWQLPGGGWENNDPNQPIPGVRLSPYGGSDLSPASTPDNLRATMTTNTQATLTWNPSVDEESGIDHYIIYRDGVSYGTSPSTSFTDSSGVSLQSQHRYQVAAVNGSGFSSVLSATLIVAPSGVGTGSITVNVASQNTPDTTPGLSGAVDDRNAMVSVQVNGRYYVAANNGNGTWTLADNAIAPALPNGSYAISVSALNLAAGTRGYGSGTLRVDTAAPTMQIAAVTPSPRSTPVTQVQIAFSEPIANLSLANIHLAHNGSSDLITGAETLTSADNKTWVLGNLSPIDAASGSYTLTVTPSGVADLAGNELGAGASAGWVMSMPGPIDAPAGSDHYTLRLDATHTIAQFFLASPTTGTPDLAIPRDMLDAVLVFNMPAGAHTLSIDFSNGNPLPAGGMQLTGSGLGNALELVGSSGDDVMTSAAGQVTFAGTPVQFTGVPAVQFHGGGGQDSLDIQGGSYAFDPADVTQTLHLTASGNAQVDLGGSRHLAGLVVKDAARVSLPADAAAVLVVTGSLSVAGNGTVDLGRGGLVLPYDDASPESLVQQFIARGLKDQTGLIAGHAAVQGFSQSGRVLAAFDNHDAHFQSFYGETLGGDWNQVLVKYTYLGDANADGRVDPTDYAVVDGLQGLGHSWITGDLNFDGKTTPDDYAQIDGNQGAGYGGLGGPALSSLTPAPAALPEALALPLQALATAPVDEPDAQEPPAAMAAAAASSPFSSTRIRDESILGSEEPEVLA